VTPISSLERWYTISVEIMGNVVSAVIIGNVAVLISSFDASFARYRQKLDLLAEFAATYDLPSAPEPVIKAVVSELRLLECYAADVVVRAGDPATEMFFIRKGSVEIRRRSRDSMLRLRVSSEKGSGQRRMLPAGSCFGEVPMLRRQAYREDVIAHEPCEILALAYAELVQVISVFPKFRMTFAHNTKSLLFQSRSLSILESSSGVQKIEEEQPAEE
ncbi:unnamed protein product, partial [Ostreobium quekettii]